MKVLLSTYKVVVSVDDEAHAAKLRESLRNLGVSCYVEKHLHIENEEGRVHISRVRA